MPPHIQTVLSASSEPLIKLAIIADKVSEGCWFILNYLCCHNCSPPPSQSSSCSVQPTMDFSRQGQIQELSLRLLN
ncbi:hypothetical protein TNCV_4402141 [Trichonephila clavipes]|nr:hypothetical protein TNCV_4402141 [Trichonephila clavipes]